MANVKKTCRICGDQYEACRSTKSTPNVFYWQEVACSPECGMKYLQKVNESRDTTPKPKRVKRMQPLVSDTEAPEIDIADTTEDIISIDEEEAEIIE
jgi:hypothetical protein